MYRQAQLRATYYPAGDGYARGYYPAGGFLSGLKKGIKAAVKIGSGFATGGFAGAATAGIGLLAGGAKPKALLPMGSIGSPGMKSFSGGGGGGGFSATQGGMLSTGGKNLKGGDGPWVPGYNGAPRKKYRTMNPFNFKALKRADRRMHRFAKAVRHFVTVSKQGHAGVKIRKRRSSR